MRVNPFAFVALAVFVAFNVGMWLMLDDSTFRLVLFFWLCSLLVGCLYFLFSENTKGETITGRL